MSFEHLVRLPKDRIGVIIGRNGIVKKEIENKCSVDISVDSENGEVIIRLMKSIDESEPFKAINIINAIGKGFSPEKAFRLLDDNVILEFIDLRNYVGKSTNALTRIKGRIIGFNGKSRRNIEEISGCKLSVYGHTVAIVGIDYEVKAVLDAVIKLASGSVHRTVYKNLQNSRTQAKLNKMKLWED